MLELKAYLVFAYYSERDKPMCVIVANSIEKAIKQTGGKLIGLFKGKFQVHIPLNKCRDSLNKGAGRKNILVYTKGPIQLEIDPNFFTGGVLALVEVPLMKAAS